MLRGFQEKLAELDPVEGEESGFILDFDLPTTGVAMKSSATVLRAQIDDITEDEISAIMGMEYRNGSLIAEGESLYELVHMIKSLGKDSALLHLRSRAFKDVADLIFSSDEFKEEKSKRGVERDLYKNKMKAISGVFTCPKCGGSRTTQAEKQTRSADEPMTVFVRCLAAGCGHKWRFG